MEVKCALCPRNCKADRAKSTGYCNVGGLKVARVSLHKWEEPIISGKNGSGAIFFSGCNLRCAYCQNFEISRGKGKDITPQILADIFKKIEDSGAHNINLVTPTHFADGILEACDIYPPNLPLVYNCGGYESVDTLERLKDAVDVWLTDFKYSDDDIASEYSSCKNYVRVCSAAVKKMRELCPTDVVENDIMKKGLIIRHLVLPNATQNSKGVINWIANNLSKDTYLSIMGQYVPFGDAYKFPRINRKLKPLEYKIIVEYAKKLELFNSFIQSLDSASQDFIPNFDESPIDF